MEIQRASRLLRVGNWHQFSLLPISVLVLSACAHAPDQNLSAPKAATAYSSDHAFQSDNKVGWPENKWWVRYNDAQLNEMVAEAIHDSPSLKAAAARLQSAQGMAQQAGAARYIQAGMALSASETKVSYQYQAYAPPQNWNDYGSATLNFSYDFDFWGKNKVTVHQPRLD